MSSCLGKAELVRLHADELDGDRASKVRAHLKSCAGCRKRNAELAAEHEAFVSQLRGLSLAEWEDAHSETTTC
ncbi:MAG: zf-HC2 domain-containing protein [Planctomycetota bacterium]|jgi:anti-sigma factor RsiW